MSGSEHSRWSEDLAAYMLGALDAEEAAGFERHLEGCGHCREEMRWLEPALQTLPESVERLEMPKQLRETVMEEVRGDVREAEDRSSAPRPWRRWLLKPAAGLAVVALLVAGVVGYEVGNDGSGNDGAASTLERTLHLANLDQPPPGKVLEAWVEREGEVEAVPALLVPDRHGQAETRIDDMSGVKTVMVTEEPSGGSEAPTGEPIMTMSVPQ